MYEKGERERESSIRDGDDAYRDAIGVFLANTFALGLALLEGVLVLELGPHNDGINRNKVQV